MWWNPYHIPSTCIMSQHCPVIYISSALKEVSRLPFSIHFLCPVARTISAHRHPVGAPPPPPHAYTPIINVVSALKTIKLLNVFFINILNSLQFKLHVCWLQSAINRTKTMELLRGNSTIFWVRVDLKYLNTCRCEKCREWTQGKNKTTHTFCTTAYYVCELR
jgi:hypothetical protein